MEFELTGDAEAVASLPKLKALAGNRNGRARGQPLTIIWHDSPDQSLLRNGLTLAEERGTRRLERIVPSLDTWLPGQPPPAVAEAPDPDTLPAPLAPVAAFEGRRAVTIHRFGDATVTVTVEKGVLRAVTSEHPVARIRFSGPESAVREAALLISGAIPVSVPVASLAAEGVALATGKPPQPRHDGAPVLPEGLSDVRQALAHILGHLLDVILACAPEAADPGEAGVHAVHQMRVAVRRARSALSIFRPALPDGVLAPVNDGLKALGRQLGPCRDWDVLVDETIPTIQKSVPNDARLERLAAAAARQRQAHRATLTTWLAGPEFRRLCIELAWFTAADFWRAPAQENAAPAPLLAVFGSSVLQQRWKRLVSSAKGMDDLDIPGLHNVRLRAKRARYAAEMFATLYHGKLPRRFIRRLSVLQQRLGVLNDGAVATHLLEELGGASGRHGYAIGLVVGYMAARAGRIRPQIIAAYEKFRRQPAYWT